MNINIWRKIRKIRSGMTGMLACLLSAITAGLFLLPGATAMADTKENKAPEYKWTFVKQVVYEAEDGKEYTRNASESSGVNCTYHEKDAGHDYNTGKDFDDDITFTMKCSAPPLDIYEGDEVTFDISVSKAGTCTAHYWSATCRVIWDSPEIGYGGVNGGYETFDNVKNKNGGDAPYSISASTTGLWGENQGASTAGDSITVYKKFGRGSDDEERSIYFDASGTKVEWRYRCEYIDPSEKSGKDGEDGDKDDDDEWEIVDQDYKTQTEDTNASGKKGEQETGIDTEVIEKKDPTEGGKYIAVALGLVAVAGGGLAMRYKRKKNPNYKEGNQKKEQKPRSSYRMILYKEFGDTISAGNTLGYKVYARIEETTVNPQTGAKQVNQRGDMTAKIEVRAVQNLKVIMPGLGSKNGFTYKQATIKADVGDIDNPPETAVVAFSYKGEGGCFENNVTFKLAGAPMIHFYDEYEGGDYYKHEGPLVTAIAGGGGTQRLRFYIEYAPEDPVSVNFHGAEGFDFSYEKVQGQSYVYDAVIMNRTQPIVKEDGVFADTQEYIVTIEAAFRGGIKAAGDNRFRLEVYPEGLTVLKKATNETGRNVERMGELIKDGHIEVCSYLTRSRDEETLDPLIKPTSFYVMFAVQKDDGSAEVLTDSAAFRLDNLKATDEATTNILSKYKYQYDSSRISDGEIAVCPQDSLPELIQKYYVTLPVSVSCKGYSARIDIPVRLIGEVPPPSSGFRKEYKKLIHAIMMYLPEEEKDRAMSQAKEKYMVGRQSGEGDVSQVRADRRMLIIMAQEYWINEVNRQNAWADMLIVAEFGAKCAKFAGDICFTILISQSLGPQAEAVLSPTKDFIAESIGNMIANYSYGGDTDYLKSFKEKSTEGVENFILSFIEFDGDDVEDITHGKGRKVFLKAAVCLAGYFVIQVTKAYCAQKKNEKDFWAAFIEGCKGVSVQSLKMVFGKYVGDLLNHEKVREFFAGKFMKYINSVVPGVTTDNKSYGYHEIADQLLGKMFEGCYEIVTGEDNENIQINKNGELSYCDKVRFRIDFENVNPVGYNNIGNLTKLEIDVDLKKLFEQPNNDGFALACECFAAPLGLSGWGGSILGSFIPDIAKQIESMYKSGQNIWNMMKNAGSSEQVGWDIFKQ